MASDTPVSDSLTKLPPNAMITHVPVSNERGTNLTNLTSLEVENAKGGLGPSPNNKNNNKLVHLHITNVLLNANNKNYDRDNYTRHHLGHALHAYTLGGLLELIRTPSMIVELRWKDKDDGNKEKMFDEEVYEDIRPSGWQFSHPLFMTNNRCIITFAHLTDWGGWNISPPI